MCSLEGNGITFVLQYLGDLLELLEEREGRGQELSGQSPMLVDTHSKEPTLSNDDLV